MKQLVAVLTLFTSSCLCIAQGLPLEQYKIECAIDAAQYYEIPANVLLAVAEMEGGKIGQRVRNSNGTYDIGAMQFNTAYINELTTQYGINEAHLSGLHDACYPFKVAAWRIRQHLVHDSGDLWTRIANYHSRTRQYNTRYRNILIVKSAFWGKWLSSTYSTITYDEHRASTEHTK